MKLIFFKKSLIIRFFIIFALLILFVIISAFSYTSFAISDISSNVLRLHIIANSDSEADQNLKYKVRDSILQYMNTLCKNVSTKEDAIKIANNHIDDFYKIANKTIEDSGFTYPVKISIGQCDFPTKYYGDIVLPAGSYDALRVQIGNASGHNWWCVMFPPLCFVDVSSGIVPDDSKNQLKNTMGDEEYYLINTNKTTDLSFKFKIIELIDNIKMSVAKK